MEKILLIITMIFVLTVSAVGCGTTTPTTTPVPTEQQVAQPTLTPYPTQVPPTPYSTQVPPTPYPTQVLPTLYPTQVPTPVPYRPSGMGAKEVLLGYGFKDRGNGDYVWAVSNDGMWIEVILLPTGGFKMFILQSGYTAHADFIAKIITGFVGGGEISYDMADWLLSGIPVAASKPIMETSIFTLEDTIYTNNSGIDFIELIALPVKK